MATIIIISGNKNQGKSSLIKKIIKLLEQNNKTFAGFYAEKIIYDDLVFGYDMITLPKKKRFPFLRTVGNQNQQRIGNFFINDFTLAEGTMHIKNAIHHKVAFLILDEIGKLELQNKGWYYALEKASKSFNGKIILAVRTQFVEKVIKKWNLKNTQIVSVKDFNSNLFENEFIKS